MRHQGDPQSDRSCSGDSPETRTSLVAALPSTTSSSQSNDADANRGTRSMPDTRLIERWLPIAALGEESVRERRSMTAIASDLLSPRLVGAAAVGGGARGRARVPAARGCRPGPVSARAGDSWGSGGGAQGELTRARRDRENLRVGNPYNYNRAFSYSPSQIDLKWLKSMLGNTLEKSLAVLDPTAGGGSIPFETTRIGLSARGERP